MQQQLNNLMKSLALFELSVDPEEVPEKRLEDMLRLGELCIEVLQQNEEHHSEVFTIFTLSAFDSVIGWIMRLLSGCG